MDSVTDSVNERDLGRLLQVYILARFPAATAAAAATAGTIDHSVKLITTAICPMTPSYQYDNSGECALAPTEQKLRASMRGSGD
jgi:hypothetical protein